MACLSDRNLDALRKGIDLAEVNDSFSVDEISTYWNKELRSVDTKAMQRLKGFSKEELRLSGHLKKEHYVQERY